MCEGRKGWREVQACIAPTMPWSGSLRNEFATARDSTSYVTGTALRGVTARTKRHCKVPRYWTSAIHGAAI
jgi:hypothetical protein